MASDQWYTLRRRNDIELRDELLPGEYCAPRDKQGTPKITWKCPRCRRLLGLSRQHHDVRFNGTTTPQVTCPFKDCTFDEWIYFENWIPAPKGSA